MKSVGFKLHPPGEKSAVSSFLLTYVEDSLTGDCDVPKYDRLSSAHPQFHPKLIFLFHVLDAQTFCFFADTHARTPNSESNLHSFAIPLRAPPPPLPPPPHSPLCDLLLQRIKSLFCTKTDEAPAHVHKAATEHFPFCPFGLDFGLDFTCRCTLEELRSRSRLLISPDPRSSTYDYVIAGA